MQELITEKIKEITASGKLDEIVTKEVTEAMQRTVRDVLRSYGDVGKALEEKLKNNLLGSIEKLDFVQYSKVLTDLVEAELNKTILSTAILPVKEMIATFTGELEKKEWKISEIIERYKEQEVIPDEHGESGTIAFVHEKSDYGTYHIAFDKEEGKNDRRYSCKYRLMVDSKTKKLYPPTVDGIGIHPITEMGGLYGFDLFLFKLYATKCTIDCDVDNVEIDWSTYND